MISHFPRVLCIDDSPEVLSLVSAALGAFRMETAITKEQGIEKARTGGYSLVIIDYSLPDGTGEELYNLLRIFDKKTPVLFMTGGFGITDREARSIGAMGSLRKGNVDFVGQLRSRVNGTIGHS